MFTTFSLRLGEMGVFIRPILMTFEYGVLFFFLVYSITLFAASLTGTGFMRFVFSAYIAFMPLILPILFFVTVDVCGIHGTILNINYFMSMSAVTTLCPPLRLFNLFELDAAGRIIMTDYFCKDILVVFLTAVVLYGIAFILYRVRPSESASHSVIWKPAIFVFKYVTVFTAGTLFGLVFMGIFDSVIWMIFGVIFGSAVSFMFTNGILHKSARAIFKGLKGFFIYMAVMAVVTTVFYLDVFGMFASVPNSNLVSSVKISLDGEIAAEYGGDFAEKLTDMIYEDCLKDKEILNGIGYYDYYNDGEYEQFEVTEVYSEDLYKDDIIPVWYTPAEMRYDNVILEAVFHTKFGIPYPVIIYTNCEDVHEIAEYIVASGKRDKHMPDYSEISNAHMELYFDPYTDNDDFLIKYGPKAMCDIIKRLRDPYAEKNDSLIVGCIYMYVDDGRSDYDSMTSYVGTNRKYYITAKDVEILNELKRGEDFFGEDDIIKYYIDKNNIEGIFVVDNDARERIYLTDRNKIVEMIKASYSLCEYTQTSMCNKEHRYSVFLNMNRDEGMNGEMSEDDYYYMEMYRWYKFRKGNVPVFVTELFSK